MPSFKSLGDTVKPQIIEMNEGSLQGNASEQELVGYSSNRTQGRPTGEVSSSRITREQIVTVSILCFVNLINYMDRYTIAGLLVDISKMYHLSESESGLLQTAFILVYMVMAPLYGYLGDRFNRKILMATGVFLWSLTTLVGSFMNSYSGFLIMRCFVGIGEASYSTIAPTLISDIFVSNTRSKMLALFYFAIPVGSGLGYIVGSEVANIAERVMPDDQLGHAWRWGLRVTPALGLVAVLLIVFVLKEPPRGESEGGAHLKATSFVSDLKHLFTNRSYVLTTIAFTCVTYVAGALAWWGPKYVELGVAIQDNPNVQVESVPFVFGVIAMLAGLIGVPLGSYLGQKYRRRLPAADPIVCGAGLLISFPLVFGGMLLAGLNTIGACMVVFFGQIFLNLNWAIVADIVLYVCIPTRRSSAEAFQILFSHAFGDAGSPYIVGVVAEAFKPVINGSDCISGHSSRLNSLNATDSIDSLAMFEPLADQDCVDFKALQYSLMICLAAELLAALFFFLSGLYIVHDKEICDKTVAGESFERDPSDAAVPQPVHRFADDAPRDDPASAQALLRD